jgi:sugar lactone lactonase YvrE
MPSHRSPLVALLVAALLWPAAAPAASHAQRPQLVHRKVATFDHQVTGVTVSATGRIFVSFPRWTEDVPVSVAELRPDGSTVPYPDAAWNAWRNSRRFELSPADHFVCVQSVVVDHQDHLWVLDPGAPAMDFLVPGAPKLVEIDLATNQVLRVLHFDQTAAPQGSYLNDVRFTPDGRYAFITDSGQRGAIVVVDLMTGTARRTLDGDPTTQPDPSVVIRVGGQVVQRPDHRRLVGASDGIALSNDGSTLYWQALTGVTLYAAPAAALEDPSLAPAALSAQVRVVGRNGVADGLWIDQAGRMWVTAPEQYGVKLRRGSRLSLVLHDRRLSWPDTFSEGPDGTIFLTTSHIQQMQWFHPRAPKRLHTELWSIAAP